MKQKGWSWPTAAAAICASCLSSMLAGLSLQLAVVNAEQTTATTSMWETCGRSLLKDGNTFFIRGVNYSPSPIGGSAGVDFLLKPELWQRDLPLLRSMHANAIKVYYYDPSSSDQHNSFLNAAYNRGADAIYTVFMVWIPPYLMEDWVPIDDSTFVGVVERFRLMTRQTASHPGTMGYSIGGETNFQPAVQSALYWQKFNTITAVVRNELAALGAKKILTTTYIDDGGTTNYLGESFNADVDIWGTDVYRGTIAEVVLPAYRAVPGGKPLLFAEYGMSFASNNAAATDSEAQQISVQLTGYAAALEANFLGQDSVGEAIAVGGFVFAFSDEWWKDGNWFNHDFGSAPNPHYVLGINSEEYYGLFAVSKNPDPSQVDILTPRPLVAMLTVLWSRPIDGFSVVGCGVTPSIDVSSTSSPSPTETSTTTSLETQTSPSSTPTSSSDAPVPAPTVVMSAAASASSAPAESQEQLDDEERPSSSSGISNVSEAVVPATVAASRTCFASRAEQALGVAAVYDPSCSSTMLKNTTLGCQTNGCRFCRMFQTEHSTAFPLCPSLAAMTTSLSRTTIHGSATPNTSFSSTGACATDTLTCASGLLVTRDSNTNCSFMKCPDIPSDTTEIACDAGVGNLRLGINMYYDQSCTVSDGGLGCDLARPGCRYCRDISWNSAASTTPGMILPCPIAVLSAGTDDDDGTSGPSGDAPTCLVSIGNANAGIGMLPDEACLAATGGIGCAADQPGCRYCQLRRTWQSQHLLACSPASLQSASTAVQLLYSNQGSSPSSAHRAAIGCAVVAAVVLAAVVAVLAFRAHRKRAKSRGQHRHLSVSRPHSIL